MEKKKENNDCVYDVSYLIWQIMKVWQRGRHKILDEFGITSSQLEMLGALYNLTSNGKEVSQIFLSQETTIDPMTTSTILRNLEKKGLIVRKESKKDLRARAIELTDEGRQLFEKALDKVRARQEILYQYIDRDLLRQQLQILLDTINKLKSELE